MPKRRRRVPGLDDREQIRGTGGIFHTQLGKDRFGAAALMPQPPAMTP